MSKKDRWSGPRPPGEPEALEPESSEPRERVVSDLRRVLGEVFEVEREEAPAELPPSGYRGGIVPPPGPLPRRFGPPTLRVWFTRLMTAAVVLYGLGSWLRAPLEGIDLGLGAAVAALALLVGVLAGVRGWQRKRGEIEALAVVFEPIGVRVATNFFSRSLAWGDLVGLEPPTGAAKDWTLLAEVEGRPLRVRLPAKQDWSRRLVDVLRGKPEDRPRG